MARIRTIKPEFFINDLLAELPPLDRLLFIGLWTQSDREGRLEDRPRKIKVAILPYDDHDINEALDRLQSKSFIVRYSVNGCNFIQINNFLKHQYPNIKEQESTIPAPSKHRTSIPLLRKGKERKGKEHIQINAFEKFWEVYPKKKSKGQAEKAFIRINPNEQLLATMLAKIEQARTSEDWTKSNGQFIPYPATWLNAQGWEDEYQQPTLSEEGVISQKLEKSKRAFDKFMEAENA